MEIGMWGGAQKGGLCLLGDSLLPLSHCVSTLSEGKTDIRAVILGSNFVRPGDIRGLPSTMPAGKGGGTSRYPQIAQQKLLATRRSLGASQAVTTGVGLASAEGEWSQCRDCLSVVLLGVSLNPAPTPPPAYILPRYLVSLSSVLVIILWVIL